jgi:hypothetical protein
LAGVPLSLAVTDVAVFNKTAVADAVAAAAGLPAGAVAALSVTATISFTLSFAGAESLSASAQTAVTSVLVSVLLLPDASYVAFESGNGRRLLLQSPATAGAVALSASGVPERAFGSLATYTSASIAATIAAALASTGLTVSSVSAPTFTVLLVLAIDSPSPAAALAAAIASGGLASALTAVGVAGATIVGAGCAASPCYPGAACVDAPATGAYTCGACPVGYAGDGVVCAPCSALQPPTLLLAFNTPVLRSTPLVFYSAVALPTAPDASACSFGAGFSYAWTVRDGTGSVVATSTSASALSLASGALAAGAASVSLTVGYVSAPSLATSTSSLPFAVDASPLIAAISGGGAQVAANSSASLDGSLSRDPDSGDPAGSGLAYVWTCASVLPASGACLDVSGDAFQPGAAATVSLQRLAGGAAPGLNATYVFTLAVSKDTRSDSLSTTVTVVNAAAALPVVSITALPVKALNPSTRIVLRAIVTPATPGDTVVQAWSVTPPPNVSLDLTDPTKSSTPVTFSSFVLLPDALQGGAVYLFRLTAWSYNPATRANTSAFAEVAVPTTAVYPTPGSLTAYVAGRPATGGAALSTRFDLAAVGWSAADAADLPLLYSFGYAPTALVSPPRASPSDVTILSPFRPSPNASVYLPSGALTALVFVQGARGATTLLSTVLARGSVPLTVTAVDVAADAAVTSTAAAQAVAASAAGLTDTALQLAGALGTELNAAPASASTLGDRLVLRELLISAASAASAAAAFASASQLQAVAGTLKALTAVPTELSPGARALAVATLAPVASAGVAVNLPTAAAVLLSLSNVSIASVDAIATDASGNASLGLPVLQGVLAAVGSLASSLQAQLSVAGEAPVSLRAPNISTTVALDLVSPASRLFTSSTSAPGAGDAAFGALPPNTLASYASLSAVNTSFFYMTFDPHSGAVGNGSGTARLLLTSEGVPLEVANLSAPIAITLPALSAAALAKGAGVCAFWIATREAYSADACASLPNPMPLGMNATLNASAAAARAAGPVELAAAVVLGPASHPLLAGCQVVVLDCATRGADAVFWFNANSPLDAPVDPVNNTDRSVRCQDARAGGAINGLGGLAAQAPPVLVVYYDAPGRSCPLWRPSNAAGCYWNATVQTFLGPRCAPRPGPERCLCRHVRRPRCRGRSACSLLLAPVCRVARR